MNDRVESHEDAQDSTREIQMTPKIRAPFRQKQGTSRGGTREDDAERVWTPLTQLVNLEGGQAQLLDTTVEVTTANNATKPSLTSIEMDLIYPGTTNDLTITRHYTGKFTCDFELYAYPFDVQKCLVKLRLPQAHESHVLLTPEEGQVLYLGAPTLTLYTVQNVRFTDGSGGSHVSVYFELHRRKGVIVMSTFLPSILLLMVSWATLFVRLDALNVRAMMSLTTLLVLYTFFSNLSRSLPSTASIKLIDIWFFFIIFLLFANIVIHIFVKVETQRKADKNQITVVQPQGVGPLTKEKTHISLRLMLLYRKVILPVIIIIFSVVFWATVFYH
ncbi:gamma-aminobutyric acid receptor subunit delta-like [Penaeus monodon]|uniref:gamma-aminobutyric acid receptor subunit delta-like n=1 Tax=Penaeus monodon TaxID=6687 RepID=UPI0018A6F1A3|nr:gamma-aminobutyric acid receptor subunit delta-like [Penaeus monodon]